MTLLQFLNLLECILFVELIIYILLKDFKSLLNRLSAAFLLCFAVWNVSDFFVHNPLLSKETIAFVNKIGSLGWISFSAFFLWFCFAFTENKRILKARSFYMFLIGLALLFIYLQWTDSLIVDYTKVYFGWSVVWAKTIWAPIFHLYITFLMVGGLCILFVFLKKIKDISKKKQAKIIIIGAIVPLISGMLTDIIFPSLNIRDFPSIASNVTIIWALGVVYAIVKYKFLTITPATAADNILSTMNECLILLDDQGDIVTVNGAASGLLGYREEELKGKKLNLLFTEGLPVFFPHEGKFDLQAVQSPVSDHEIRYVSRDKKTIPLSLSASAVLDARRQLAGIVVILRDISAQKDAELSLKYMATHDHLTDLPNRLLLYDRFTLALARARRYRYLFAIFLLDVDRFKEINDTLGHETGDLLLKEVSRRLVRCVREYDTVARMGGDEFIVLLGDLKEEQEVGIVAQRILKQLEQPVKVSDREISITVSIGISLYPSDGDSIETLLKDADIAMYSAKRRGGNGFVFFSSEMGQAIERGISLKHDLKKAVERQEFFLHYQPLIEIQTGKLSGFEALLRWQHPGLGLVGPLSFIPIAEATGLIVPIGEWVLQTACRQSRAWVEEGFPPVPMAVNISIGQLHKMGLSETLTRILKETGLAPNLLVLEITESAAMHNIGDAVPILGELHKQGVQIVIDDFGSGYSSLNLLRRLPIQALKIDRTFIQHIVDDPADAAIVRAIIAMAHSLNIRVVAEGVETREQLYFLHSLKWTHEGILHCDQAQGFLFSKPLPAAEIRTLLATQQREGRLIPAE